MCLILISELIALIQGIHMISSLLWWSTTFVIIFVIRPANRTGSLAIVLPKIRRVIILSSTISIVSGLILFGWLFNFSIQTLAITTTKSILILIFGPLSLIVYYHILLGTRTRLFNPKSNMHKEMVLVKILPYLMFSLLTTTMISMVIASSIVLF